jgi:site-specific DNA-methyltransferase (adenine-specific)
MERSLLENGADVFIRYNDAIPIVRKVASKNEESISSIISSQRPFGLPTNFSDFHVSKKEESDIKVYANRKVGYVSADYPILKNRHLIQKYKVLTPKAIGSGDSKQDWVKPLLAEKGSICTETYIVLGAFDSEEKAKNLISYTQTKFFHFMLTLKKNTQDALSRVYSMIPMQDFDEEWNDEKLYKKYELSESEIEFINMMICHMEDK